MRIKFDKNTSEEILDTAWLWLFPMSVDPDQLASERPADQDPHCKVQELS